ncbi:cytidylyltransferase domain-containing protein [Ectothiorhodospira shaposhnikovii]|uniref:acylneuraminate cytidylyltransferase family protein n=1 Tax=Ectothiorhodospira shaposhnikovii TaxID=1054 RepID=UPI0039A0EF16
MVKRRIAIIPARGGSKRIPHKNIIDFCGKPMIAWTIQAAKQTELFDRIIVSTDDPKIAEVSIAWGAEVPFLRSKYADDFTAVSEATSSALQQARSYWDESYSSVTQLMANCPLRTADDINHAISRFETLNRAFQISCFKYGWMNPWWSVKLDVAGHPERLFPEAASQRSQDLPELFCPTGAIWVANADDLMKSKTFYGPNHVFEPISWESAIDIDDYDDLRLAEALCLRVL